MNLLNSLKLYAVTDSSLCRNKTLEEMVEEAIIGGVTIIQLREKHLTHNDFLLRAKSIKGVCDKYNVPLIINDDIMVAKECAAAGVHIGQGDISCKDARKILGYNYYIGVSAHNIQEAREAENQGADYIGVGAVFTTKSKDDARSVAKDELINIINSVSIPVVAIGGINKGNIIELQHTGINGVAIISGIFGSDNITSESKEIKDILDKFI
ncbi:MAG: thiamine phosphate synthase [Clostridium sp.]